MKTILCAIGLVIGLSLGSVVLGSEVSGDVDCQETDRDGYHFECKLLLGVDGLQSAGTFLSSSSGQLEREGSLQPHLSVFQFIPSTPLRLDGLKAFLFWVYNSREQKVVFTGTANMPIQILDVDGKIGNEIVVRHHVAKYTPIGFVQENSPHLVAYSISEDNVVQMLDPLQFAGFAGKNHRELTSLKNILEDRLELLHEFDSEGIVSDVLRPQIEEYILFQLQLIDYQIRASR